MRESQQVLEWMAIGERTGRIDSLLLVLATRFPPEAPADLESAIRAATSGEQLQNWLNLAVTAKSLEDFRKAASL